LKEGKDCIDAVHGEFGLALYAPRKRRLILARDRVGARMLYHTVTKEAVYFAFEAGALLGCPGVARALDDEGAYHHFPFSGCPAPYTLYKGVRKLRPAEMVAFCVQSSLFNLHLSVPRNRLGINVRPELPQKKGGPSGPPTMIFEF